MKLSVWCQGYGFHLYLLRQNKPHTSMLQAFILYRSSQLFLFVPESVLHLISSLTISHELLSKIAHVIITWCFQSVKRSTMYTSFREVFIYVPLALTGLQLPRRLLFSLSLYCCVCIGNAYAYENHCISILCLQSSQCLHLYSTPLILVFFKPSVFVTRYTTFLKQI